jgi:hypothetical protein
VVEENGAAVRVFAKNGLEFYGPVREMEIKGRVRRLRCMGRVV